ncbi:MAG: hypothetical protein H0U25_11100 [Thermoleophilaceae bacterium]|nr:hypothetical protein [Thermoleophilaceae bacterium]
MKAARRLAAAIAALSAVAAPVAFADFTSDEPATYNKTNERFALQTGTPEFQTLLRSKEPQSDQEALGILTGDPERRPQGNLCFNHRDGCAGDVRFYDWPTQAGNLRKPVLWTARSGATISGHVWVTEGGPARKPGVVITNGSVQAPEQLYWAQAAVLAQAGYVVLTWDPQTQGRSDGPGAAPTENENSQAQTVEAFTEGTVDALDFFFSNPGSVFRPRNSRTMPGVNHSAKQDRRVAAGKNAAFNPLHTRLDTNRIGIAGHSLGAFAVSQVSTQDERVDAVVAWDQLAVNARTGSGAALKPRVPALGMSGDYGIGSPNGAAGVNPKPRQSAPDPQGANGPSRTYSKAGLPTMQVNTRAGTHFEPALIPNAGFPATLRGIDQTAWYTLAWFDRYLRGEESADRRLLTDRWQKDAEDAKADPAGNGNLFSASLRSRVDIVRADGAKAVCEDLRTGCGLLGDDRSGPFSALDFGFGRQTLTAVRPARCATRIREPKRLDLSRSKRRVTVRLRLAQNSRVGVYAKRARRGVRGVRRRKALPAGSRRVVVRLRRRARPGRYRVRVGVRCTGGTQRKVMRVRVVR